MNIGVENMSKNKEIKKKCKCKRICFECCHFVPYSCGGLYNHATVQEHCAAYPSKEIVSCVNGEKTTILANPGEYNKNGDCKKFKPLSNVRLMKLLKEYISDNSSDWACRPEIKKTLAKDLLKVLEGKKSDLVEGLYDGDTPYDYYVIVSKKAIEDSLRRRGYNIDYRRKNDVYGDWENTLNEDEYKKEKSWIKRMKFWDDEK